MKLISNKSLFLICYLVIITNIIILIRRKILKKIIGLFGFTLILLIVTPVLSVVTIPSNNRPRPIQINPPHDNDPLVVFLKNNLLSLIYGMENANFSSGDILYTEFTTEESYTNFLPIIRSNNSVEFNLSHFKVKLNNYLSLNHPRHIINNSFLRNIQKELENISTIEIIRSKIIKPIKDIDIKAHFVVILWDNDTSVINAIKRIQQNESLSDQIFSGDEIITTIQLRKTTESVYGWLTDVSTWEYDDGSSARNFRYLIEQMGRNPTLARSIVRLLDLDSEINILKSFTGLKSGLIELQKNQARKNAHLGFTVSQLQIKDLNLIRRNNGNIGISKLNYIYVEHQSLGWTVFNDTNNNGIMDLGMKTIQSFRPGLNETVVPTRSNESLYRVDFQEVGSIEFIPISIIDNEISFGLNATDVKVKLNPISIDRDSTVFSDEYSVGGLQTIDTTNLVFHFYPNATSGSAILKFDYEVGDWSNKSVLEGLSLNHLLATTVRNIDATDKELKLQANGTDFDLDADAMRTRNLRFQAGQLPIAGAELDEIPYNWASNEEIYAFGQTLPSLYGQMMFGTISSEAESLRALQMQANKATYLYSVSYPKFSGERIVHDPTFSMVVAGFTGYTEIPSTIVKEAINFLISKPNLFFVTTILSAIAVSAYIISRRRF
jgi:hypothetical protein